jgi:hypothetical protein
MNVVSTEGYKGNGRKAVKVDKSTRSHKSRLMKPTFNVKSRQDLPIPNIPKELTENLQEQYQNPIPLHTTGENPDSRKPQQNVSVSGSIVLVSRRKKKMKPSTAYNEDELLAGSRTFVKPYEITKGTCKDKMLSLSCCF